MKVKLFRKIIIFLIIFFSISVISNILIYKNYMKKSNENISNIIGLVKEKYPMITDNEILSILNNKDSYSYDLSKYGIYKNDMYMTENIRNFYYVFIISNSLIVLVLGIILVYIIFKYIEYRTNKVYEITNYIKEINKKNYELKLDENIEDELSILQNEIYKTTIFLKEQSENAIKDKKNVKDNLSDISHQLKTPLTSINIMLDNIIDDDKMSEETKKEFLTDAKQQIENINFLIISLLKLSRFDANVIKFTKENINVKDILTEIKKNLKNIVNKNNISIEIIGDNDVIFVGDYKWEMEALTNIIKNGVESLNENGTIKIFFRKLSVYTEIIIEDNGKGINLKDLRHIFDRFYKGETSKKDSIGIGLSLSKKIIEIDNGYITVDSKIGKGTKFTIKYMNT
jgi:Signal transduction histidine kinase